MSGSASANPEKAPVIAVDLPALTPALALSRAVRVETEAPNNVSRIADIWRRYRDYRYSLNGIWQSCFRRKFRKRL